MTRFRHKHGLVGTAVMIIAVSCSAPALGHGLASAQQIRALSDGAAVRLDPSDSSPVIANLAPGATLDWIGESGPYHIVSIPGQPGEDDLIGYVLASEVEVVGAVSGGGNPSMAGSGIPDIHAQYERSKARRSSGLKRWLWGGALAAIAIATTRVVFEAGDEDAYSDSASHQAAVDRHSTARTVRNAVTLAGVGLLAWGAADYVLGSRDMVTMEGELPALADPALEEQYGEAGARRGSGKRKFVWGTIMAGGSYVTVKWVPWLGAPEREDYDTEWEYLSAVHRRDRTETANRWFIGVGSVLAVWGAVDWVLGSRKMSEIEAISRVTSSPARRGAPARVGPDLFVRRVVGRTEIGLAWSR
ncbi:MAG: SH3 domain-containing protein [Gemmatimonadetes bacterium]|nr:SH3 domain-containing protein [Gemmatimonadota bacterium]MYA63114.1 SH3 domain-containing protein [Gemmatimonadota bacterium]MYB97283.1 SH3 domain-containing protein [Gemmatimonadota bacterium]MYH52422.1 SH3 domain-containing protein [Gemmatimonadota bacterium]MYI45810.1 SH3 domain-containing protein [Gemmatimonadota bacterium]